VGCGFLEHTGQESGFEPEDSFLQLERRIRKGDPDYVSGCTGHSPLGIDRGTKPVNSKVHLDLRADGDRPVSRNEQDASLTHVYQSARKSSRSTLGDNSTLDKIAPMLAAFIM